MKIVIETANFDKGGLERVVLDSAIELAKLGFFPHIVTNGDIGILAREARLRGISVHHVKNRLQMLALMIQLRPRVSISHFTYFGYSIYHLLSIPNITFIHNVYAFLNLEGRNRISDSDRFVQRYISVSKNATQYAVSNLGIDPSKIETIANGLNIQSEDEKAYDPKEFDIGDLGLSPNDYVFLNVASYNLHKGHYLMANALKRTIAVKPEVKILCLGSVVYPPHFAELQNYIKKSGLENSMLFLGHHENIQWFYKKANAFLLPSFIEGWSIAMNEAMYYELPMILTSVGGAPEVIRNNDIGILIPNEYGNVDNLNPELLDTLAFNPRDYEIEEALTLAMINFVDNSDSWRVKAQISRTRILEEYTLGASTKKYAEVIRKVTEK